MQRLPWLEEEEALSRVSFNTEAIANAEDEDYLQTRSVQKSWNRSIAKSNAEFTLALREKVDRP